MEYFNLDADFHPITSAVGPNPHISQILLPANEEASSHLTGDTWVDPWGVIAPPSPVDLTLGQPNFDSWLPDSSMTQPAGYGRPSLPYPGQYHPEVQAEPEPIGLSNWDGSLAARAARESSLFLPPTSVPFVCWGNNQTGPAFGAFGSQNVHTTYQPIIEPAWTELGQTGWFQPHGTYRARGAEYLNAVAGPSSLAPSHLPFVGPPTTQPSGEIPKTIADAKNNKTVTGGNKASKFKRTQVSSGRRKPSESRAQSRGYMHGLLRWVQKREGLREPPRQEKALAVVAEFIATFRQMVYQEPYLRSSSRSCKKTGPVSRHAAKEQIRRDALRGSFEELSKYYLRDGGKKWKVAGLLSKVVEDLETHPASLPTPNESAPGASTPTAAASEVPANLPSANSMASRPQR